MLLNLILSIFNFALGLIYYAIVWPFLLIKLFRNIHWRKHIKVGDRCYFHNALGGKTWATVIEINWCVGKVYLNCPDMYTWRPIKSMKKY